MYPVTILKSRYGGAYEHAQWVAFNDYPEHLADAVADDSTCGVFFAGGVDRSVDPEVELPPYPGPIGRGDTPDEALADLLRQGEWDGQYPGYVAIPDGSP